MFKDRLKNRVFWTRLLVALLTALFVVPAYLFFSPEDIPEANTTKPDNESTALQFEPLARVSPATTRQQLESVQVLQVTYSPSTKSIYHNFAVNEFSEDQHQVLTLLSGLLEDYQSHELTPDQKREISAVLPDINKTVEGRNLIATFFFYQQDPEIAAAMYDMILDADIKDPILISELITREEAEFSDDFKGRLIDLVADHNTVKQMHNQKIEDFLETMAMHPDYALRQAAVSQWAWYVNQHKGILPVLDAYLFSHSSQVREEVYEMVELDAIQSISEKREVALALESLKYADYLALDEQEKIRIDALKARLSL